MFSLEAAIAASTTAIKNRAVNRPKTIAYEMFLSNDGRSSFRRIAGFTIKQLIAEFRNSNINCEYAVIKKIGDDKVLRMYNRSLGKKFFSLTRTGTKRKKA